MYGGYDPYSIGEQYDQDYAEQMRQSYLSQLGQQDQGPSPAPQSPAAPSYDTAPAPAPSFSQPLPPAPPPQQQTYETAQFSQPQAFTPQVEPQQAQMPQPQQAPYYTAEGVGVSQPQYNVGWEPGRTYQPMAGFETSRINDPNEQDPKYVAARIIQNMGLNPEDPRSYDVLTEQMMQRFPGMRRTGTDVWDFSGVPGIDRFGPPVPQDFVVNQGGRGATWAFQNTGGGGQGQPGMPQGGSPFNLGGFRYSPQTGYQFGYSGGLPPELAAFYNAQTQMLNSRQAQDAQIQGAMRDALLRMMAQGQEPVDVMNDKTLGPAAAQYRIAQERERRKNREQLAERAAFTGLNPGGQGSGAFEAAIQADAEQSRNAIAGYEAQLAQNELQNRRQMLTQAIQLAQALGARQEANDLQRELAGIDAQLRMTSMAMQQSQFEDSMGLNYNQLFANMNRDAFIYGMNG